MTSALPHALLEKFSHFITEEIGLYFPTQKWQDLERGVAAAAGVFKFEDSAACIHWLMSASLSQQQIEILASILTIGETYFFRDTNTFHALEKDILPPLICKRLQENDKRIRIWSAGCASGEEPYSIAMVLTKLIPDIQHWHITLLATDINRVSLKKLSAGIYSEWSFRGVDDDIRAIYFKKTIKEKYKILSPIKSLVTPCYLNLAKDSYPSLINNTNTMDIIFCCNVLMYFSPELMEKVVNNFFECLASDGYLIVSAGEVSQSCFTHFNIENINGVYVLQRKNVEKIAIPKVMADNATDLPVQKTPMPISINYKEMSQQFANQGKLPEALVWNEKALTENKTNPELHFMRAMILLELDQLEEAVTTLKRVLYLDEGYILAHVLLGHIFQKLKNSRDAKKHFACALVLLTEINSDNVLGDMTAGSLIDIIVSMQGME